jgi:formylglycine-generating enzyme required for sulfatase activity
MQAMNLAAVRRLATIWAFVCLFACSARSRPSADLPMLLGPGPQDGRVDSSVGETDAEASTEATTLGSDAGGDADASSNVRDYPPEFPPGMAPGYGDGGGDGLPEPMIPPSCASPGPGISDCANDGGSCCDSLAVAGGDFFRSYDGVSTGFASQASPAAVTSLRLDRYEITVGRFRQFVVAEVAGWRPMSGSGKHVHLNDGNGLTDSSSPSTFEPGWVTSWNANLAATASGWTTNLSCDPTMATWTPAAGANEDKPIGCVSWFEVYAFCIWDGGFLPSEAEWNYAASGGSDQRVYPWSTPPSSETIDCSYANYLAAEDAGGCSAADNVEVHAVGADSPKGDGKWGQSDLSGNVLEWTLDYFATYGATCPDCAYLTFTSVRVARGGSYDELPVYALASARDAYDPSIRVPYLGARCARAPTE